MDMKFGVLRVPSIICEKVRCDFRKLCQLRATETLLQDGV